MNTLKFFLTLLLTILLVTTYNVAYAATPNIGCELNQGQKYCQYLGQADADWDTALPPTWTPILQSLVPILEKLTEDKIKELISKKRKQFDLLKEIEAANKLPAMLLKQSSRMPVNKLRANNKTFRLFVIISKYEAVYACICGTKN